ncbi:MAG: methyltransferase type 12 [Acidimicrobiia bacterium]
MEIGSGLGGLAERLVQFVSPMLVSEPDERLAAKLVAKFAHDSRVTVTAPILLPTTGSHEPLDPEPVSIVMSNVLEHIDDDVKALECLLAAFPTVERLVLVVPAHAWAYSPLDHRLGHHRRYTRSSLRAVVEESGWLCSSVRYFNPVGLLAWTLSGRLLRRSTIAPWHTQAVEALLPVLILADRLLAGRLFGQSVLAAATRPEG